MEEGGDDDEDEEDEEEESEGMDDATMFRMDDKMAAYLRNMVDARRGAKERKAALSNLRLRALSLIEAFARRLPSSALLTAAVTPLLGAMAMARRAAGTASNSGSSAGAGSKKKDSKAAAAAASQRAVSDLSNRLQAVLKVLCQPARPASHGALGMTSSQMEGCLKRTLHLASREKDRATAQLAAQAWCTLLKAAATSTTEGGEPRACKEKGGGGGRQRADSSRAHAGGRPPKGQ